MFPNILVTTTREWVELLWRTTFFSGNHLLHSVVLQWSFNSPSLVHTHEPPLLPLTMLIMSITCCQVCRHLWSARNTLRGWNLQVGEGRIFQGRPLVSCCYEIFSSCRLLAWWWLHISHFRLSLTFSEDYPHKPPTVTFVDKSVSFLSIFSFLHPAGLGEPENPPTN